MNAEHNTEVKFKEQRYVQPRSFYFSCDFSTLNVSCWIRHEIIQHVFGFHISGNITLYVAVYKQQTSYHDAYLKNFSHLFLQKPIYFMYFSVNLRIKFACISV
jgi:hypothetical protein